MDHAAARDARRRIVADWNAGSSVADVAARNGRTVGAVCRQLAVARLAGWSVRKADRSALGTRLYYARTGREMVECS